MLRDELINDFVNALRDRLRIPERAIQTLRPNPERLRKGSHRRAFVDERLLEREAPLVEPQGVPPAASLDLAYRSPTFHAAPFHSERGKQNLIVKRTTRKSEGKAQQDKAALIRKPQRGDPDLVKRMQRVRGEHLRDRHVELEWQEIAQLAGMSESVLSDIVTLKRRVQLAEIPSLARALDVRKCWLAFEEGPMRPDPNALEQLAIVKPTPEGQSSVPQTPEQAEATRVASQRPHGPRR